MRRSDFFAFLPSSTTRSANTKRWRSPCATCCRPFSGDQLVRPSRKGLLGLPRVLSRPAHRQVDRFVQRKSGPRRIAKGENGTNEISPTHDRYASDSDRRLDLGVQE